MELEVVNDAKGSESSQEKKEDKASQANEKDKEKEEKKNDESASFGRTKDGAPKKSPAGRPTGPKKKLKTKTSPAPLRPAQRKVPVGKTVDPYAELTRNITEQKRIVEAIRKSHPESRIGDPVDPRGLDQTPPHEELIADIEIGDAIKSGYSMLAELMEHERIPNDKVFTEVGRKWAKASRYLGNSLTPAQIAVWGAIFSTGILATPLAWSGVEKVKRGRQRRYDERTEKRNETGNPSGTDKGTTAG